MQTVERIERSLKRDESADILLVNRHKRDLGMEGFAEGEDSRSIATFKKVCIRSSRCQIYLCLLKKIQKLLIQNEINTKRDLFYQNVNLFKNQSVVDHAIEDIACSFGIKRDQLNVIASGKGLVCGNIQLILSNGTNLDCSTKGVLIPPPHEVLLSKRGS
jgi:DNA topoisomerase VI subunit A